MFVHYVTAKKAQQLLPIYYTYEQNIVAVNPYILEKKKIRGERQQIEKVAQPGTFINIYQVSVGECLCQKKSLITQSEVFSYIPIPYLTERITQFLSAQHI